MKLRTKFLIVIGGLLVFWFGGVAIYIYAKSKTYLEDTFELVTGIDKGYQLDTSFTADHDTYMYIRAEIADSSANRLKRQFRFFNAIKARDTIRAKINAERIPLDSNHEYHYQRNGIYAYTLLALARAGNVLEIHIVFDD